MGHLYLAACTVELPFPGGSTGYVTVVDNVSGERYIVEAMEDTRSRYYDSQPGSSVLVDTTVEGNDSIKSIVIHNSKCTPIGLIDRDFTAGGTVTIRSLANIDFEPVLGNPVMTWKAPLQPVKMFFNERKQS